MTRTLDTMAYALRRFHLARREFRDVVDRVDGGDNVDEAFRRTHLRHLLAKARVALLKVIAVAGQDPHHTRGQGQRLPTEDCTVKRLCAL